MNIKFADKRNSLIFCIIVLFKYSKMGSNRDDFTVKTIDILAKRVGYLCSNPNCRKSTIGSNVIPDKATSIGIAAHISAASPGGPRYSVEMTREERKHIGNGIWLCGNCATLIDKDELKYPQKLLYEWKYKAEYSSHIALLKNSKDNISENIPNLEADLLYSSDYRYHMGYSTENFKLFGNDPIPFDKQPIILWEIGWDFSFLIFNNSSVPAFNIKWKYRNSKRFSRLADLNKINNLPPYANLDLNANFNFLYEGTANDANQFRKRRIPEALDGLEIELDYNNESKQSFKTLIKIEGESLTNKTI